MSGEKFDKEAEGALWKVPINAKTFQSGLIGVVTNSDVVIKLKNGETLGSLGLASTKIGFTTRWVTGEGLAAIGGNDNGFILKENSNILPLPANKNNGNEYYLGTGLNDLNRDGTQSKDGNFTSGNLTKVVKYDGKSKAISSVVSFKPDQNFLQANSGWVIYINEIVPAELLKYIDANKVFLGVSDSNGNFTKTPIKLTVDPNGNGHISTKDTAELSILGGDWNKVEAVRNKLDSSVFYGALGQRRSFTIQYKLKATVSNKDFAKRLNEYISKNNSQISFESYLEADFVDQSGFEAIRKPDGGKPNKRLQNSYANGFLEVIDTDHDGLYDFVEEEIGTNKYAVDTDGDGVPDNEEVLNDMTDAKEAKSYLVSKPNITTTNIDANKEQTIEGTVPKKIYARPDKPEEILEATNPNAGGVQVKAYKYVEGDLDYTDNEVKAETIIPFEELKNGDFTLKIVPGTFKEGEKVVLVAFSPDGKNPMISEKTVSVGAMNKEDFIVNVKNPPKLIENKTIEEIINVVETNQTGATVDTKDYEESNSGLSIDEKMNLVGKPKVDAWGTTEEEREVTVGAIVKSEDGTEAETIKIPVIVQRDTDGDGIPDVMDKDDDGDGISDEEEIAKGSDPKDANSIPAMPINPIGKAEISNGHQVVTDKMPIKEITVTTEDGNAKVEVNKDKLPKGITYDDVNKTISGTVDVMDWGKTEEERTFEISVTVTNEDGSGREVKVVIVVQRDTDGDGIPDAMDKDDDGDGISDEEELAKGSDPKDAKSIPATPIKSIGGADISNNNQSVTDKTPIKEITVTTEDGNAKVEVKEDKLPNGIKCDDVNKTVSGTADINDWKDGEEERTFEIPVTITNEDGSKIEETIVIVVQRVVENEDVADSNQGVVDKTSSQEAKAEAKETEAKENKSDVSNKKSPKTGDETDLIAYAGLMSLAGASLVLWGIKRKKNK